MRLQLHQKQGAPVCEKCDSHVGVQVSGRDSQGRQLALLLEPTPLLFTLTPDMQAQDTANTSSPLRIENSKDQNSSAMLPLAANPASCVCRLRPLYCNSCNLTVHSLE